MVMKELKACINENVPKSGNIYPFADGCVNGLLYTVLVCGVVHWDAVLQCGIALKGHVSDRHRLP